MKEAFAYSPSYSVEGQPAALPESFGTRLTPKNCSHLPFVEFDPALDSWSKAMLGPEDT
jgi:hypothetical protein